MRDDSTQLWDYALALYASDGVAGACLVLQDEGGADVCELLWVCWLASHGLTLADDVDDALHTIRAWQRETTRPLRTLRRALKAEAAERPGIARLRDTLKQAELLAERETLTRLQSLSGNGTRPMRRDDTLIATLQRLTPRRSPALDTALNSLIIAAGAEPKAPC